MWLEWRCYIWTSFCTPFPHSWLRGLRSFLSCPVGFFTILTLSEWLCYLFGMCVLVTQSYLTLCDPMNCSPPSSSVHGILQASILEWVACTAGRFFTIWTTRKAAWLLFLKKYIEMVMEENTPSPPTKVDSLKGTFMLSERWWQESR